MNIEIEEITGRGEKNYESYFLIAPNFTLLPLECSIGNLRGLTEVGRILAGQVRNIL